jgi:GT2 family glycosyltransferase
MIRLTRKRVTALISKVFYQLPRKACFNRISEINLNNNDIIIIIPVFNAVQETQACLDSVAKNTSSHIQVMIIDDGSTDPNLGLLLNSYRNRTNWIIDINTQNMGFTKTVNKGVLFSASKDVILLNSDTIVTPRWVENLQFAAYSRNRVATVTPMSDNAGGFSIPEMIKWFKGGKSRLTDQSGRLVTRNSRSLLPEIPIGNGFCLYIKRDCLNEVGILDEIAFPRGYGEETDFCMRAKRAGWIHLLDDRTLIFHKRAASFKAEKNTLLEKGSAIVRERYPEFSEVPRFFSNSPLLFKIRKYTNRMLRLHLRPSIKPRILYVITASSSGGTFWTNIDLMTGMLPFCEPWLLKCNGTEMTLSSWTGSKFKHEKKYILVNPLHIYNHRSVEYDTVLKQWLIEYGFELIHVRNFINHSLGLFDVASESAIPAILSLHDYYPVCPGIKLIDSDNKYCGGNCSNTQNPEDCHMDKFWTGYPFIRNQWITNWRKMIKEAIIKADGFITTSASVKSIYLSVFPEMGDKLFEIIQHGRDFNRFYDYSECPDKGDKLKILILGSLEIAKGGELVQKLLEDTSLTNVEVHLLGKNRMGLSDRRLVTYGGYKRDRLFAKIRKIKPHIGLVLSPWPETWCHTLTELWSCGIPVIGSGLGAVQERLLDSGAGWIIRPNDYSELKNILLTLKGNNSDWLSKKESVLKHQTASLKQNRISRMVESYREFYNLVQGQALF